MGLCFHLRHPSTGTCRLLSQARSQCRNGNLQESSCQWIFPGDSATAVHPNRELKLTPTSPGNTPTPTVRSGPGFYGVTALPWVPVHMKPCVHPPSVECPFPPVLWGSCTQTLPPFRAKCPGGSCFQSQTSRLGSLTWSSELSLLWEKLCNIIIFQSVDNQTGEYGILLYHEKYPFCCLFVTSSLSLDIEYLLW